MNLRLTSLVLLVLMLCAGAAAVAMKPTVKIAEAGPGMDLETLVPKSFGNWRLDTAISPILPNEEQQALLNKIYNQTLSRTYMNGAGQRVMLSIAYGGDQIDKGMQIHRPETCYASQGFQVKKEQVGELALQYGTLPIKRLLAVQGGRNEPITYWVVIGEKAAHVGFRQKLAQLSYGLSGKVPDGMLVRVSSIDPDEQRAYQLQDDFIKDLLAVLSPESRARIAGRFGN